MKDYREAVQDMKPIDAVEYLLNCLDRLSYIRFGAHIIFPFTTTNRESRILRCLFDNLGKVCSKSALYEAMYFDQIHEPYDKIIDVYISKLRKKIPEGWSIDTHHGQGWSLTTDWRPDAEVNGDTEAGDLSEVTAEI